MNRGEIWTLRETRELRSAHGTDGRHWDTKSALQRSFSCRRVTLAGERSLSCSACLVFV